jgi:hypothetical protein
VLPEVPRGGRAHNGGGGGESRRSCLSAGCPRAQGQAGAAEAKARKGNAPGRKKPRRARESHVEKSGGGNLNRQRDQTPEARPLWQQCLCAESALGTIHPRGTAIRGRFDELVFATANLGGAPASRPSVC